jgi:hypothetical protein
MEFADEFPGALVIGTDLFYVDDFESPWVFPEVGKFAFIHWRSLSGVQEVGPSYINRRLTQRRDEKFRSRDSTKVLLIQAVI